MPVAPTPGGNPYSITAMFRSEADFFRSATHLFKRSHSAYTRSRTK